MHLAGHDGGMPAERLTPERRRQMTRQALVEAAAEAFARKGFYGASLEEIAEAAGFTRGAIYSNFGSKEELLFAVLEFSIDRQLDAVSEAMEGRHSDTPEERRRDDIADAIVASRAWSNAAPMGWNWAALALELRLSALRNPTVRKRLAEVQRENRDKVARLIQQETERRGVRLRLSPEDFADITGAALDGLGQLGAIDEEDAERYHSLAEKLFVLMAEVVVEPEREPSGVDEGPPNT